MTFAIGLYQKISSVYTLTWHADIPQPRQMQNVPPQSIGTDLGGFPVVRGFGSQVWTYPYLKQSGWQYLYSLYRLSFQSSGLYTGKIRIQWPDPETGVDQTASARWNNIDEVDRDPAYVMTNFALTFVRLGIDDTTIAGNWLPPVR